MRSAATLLGLGFHLFFFFDLHRKSLCFLSIGGRIQLPHLDLHTRSTLIPLLDSLDRLVVDRVGDLLYQEEYLTVAAAVRHSAAFDEGIVDRMVTESAAL